jgi:malonate transporter and related proteins
VNAFVQLAALSAPLFAVVLLGWLIGRSRRWRVEYTDALSTFLLAIPLPALLFTLMSDLSKLPPLDARLLAAYFGGCLVVFVVARVIALALYRLDGVSQSVFALGGIFSNNVFLGVPLAKAALGEAAMPAVGLVLVFNTLSLWTLVTISVEWARHGSLSLRGFGATVRSVLTNPLVASILAGAAFGLTGWKLPALIATPLALIAQPAVPLSLVVLGMGLARYGVGTGWKVACGITALKLAGQPLAVWAIAWLLGLPQLETQAVVLLAALPVGINVYLMAREFNALEAAVASSMLVSTVAAAASAPLALSLLGVGR